MENPFDFKADIFWLAGVVLISLAVFFTSVSGDFVFDDNRQILRNPLIQNSELYAKALTSDVWAFKTSNEVAASNYWRPTFTALNIFNFYMFGTNPFAWHLINVLLHALVGALVFIFLLEIGFTRLQAFFAAAIFSVHPVHVESVAWIAGSPDILVTLFLMIAAIGCLRYRRSKAVSAFVAVLIALMLALGAKEVAVLSIPLLVFLLKGEGDWKTRENLALLAVVIGYLLLRYLVLGGNVAQPVDAASGLFEVVLTVPPAFLFYLRQSFLPFELSPTYGLRFVDSIETNTVFYFLAALVSVFLLVLSSLKERKRIIALLIFACFLLPAFNFFSFPEEEIVHDRYLYLPVLGLCMIFVSLLFEFIEKRSVDKRFGIAIAGSLVLVFSLVSLNQIPVWKNDVSLWKHASTVDSRSSFAFGQLGSALIGQKRYSEAEQAFDRSLAVRIRARSLLGRGIARVQLKKYEEASSDLEQLLKLPRENTDFYSLYQGCEVLAVAKLASGKLKEAENTLIKCKDDLPIYRAAISANLAIVLYQQQRKQEALRLLESVRGDAERETIEQSKYVFARLGMLYKELRRNEKAKYEFEEFLRQTKGFSSDTTLDLRKQVSTMLRNSN